MPLDLQELRGKVKEARVETDGFYVEDDVPPWLVALEPETLEDLIEIAEAAKEWVDAPNDAPNLELRYQRLRNALDAVS